MRFMVITKATAETEAGVPPTSEDIDTMGAFIEELVDAGVLLAAEGVRPSAAGARIYFDGTAKTVVDGPFAETKELVAGFYLVEMASLEECVAWFKRCPIQKPGAEPAHIEIRQLYTAANFGESLTSEQREAVERREESAAPAYRS